jgi:hypothetical protein
MTSEREEEIKLWLLRALLDPPSGHEAAIDQFNEADWLVIRRCAGQHRLRPMLNQLVRGSWAKHPVPEAFRVNCHRSYDSALTRQFERRALLLEVAEALTAAGIDFAVLKGCALLGGVYPNPALRPIRDLDLLIRPSDVAQASQLLIDQCGCVPESHIAGKMLDDYTVHKHAEPLWNAARGVPIELHVRLVDRPRSGDGGLLFDPERLLARAVPRKLGSRALPCLAWPETLLHLIAHGVHDHQFNNGPLLLTDAVAIARSGEVDWEEFWQLAEDGGWTGATRLTNDLLIYLTGNEAAPFGDPHGAPTPKPVLRSAAVLLLQERSPTAGVSGWSRLHARPSLRSLLKRLRLRSQNSAPGGSAASPAASVSAMLRAMLRALLSRNGRREIARSAAVYGWLEAGSGPA